MAPTEVDESLLKFATERQKEVLRSVISNGSIRAACRADEATFSYYCGVVKAVRKKAGLDSERGSDEGKRIMVIPDVQAKPGNDFSYLARTGRSLPASSRETRCSSGTAAATA